MKTFLQLLLGAMVGSILIYACYFYYSIELSSRARAGKRNERNSYLVKIGMNSTQAFHIMGLGKRRGVALNGDTIYSYESSPITSNAVSIYINNRNKVTLIGHGD